jgi:hypothetical protein
MRHLPIILFLTLLSTFFMACNSDQPKTEDDYPLIKNDLAIDLIKIAQIRLTNPTDYQQALDTLDQGALHSLHVAELLLHNCLADSLTCDSIFLVYSDFLNSVAAGYLENNETISNQLSDSPASETVDQLKSILGSYGILLDSTENTWFLDISPVYLLQNFGSAISPAYREYLSIGCREQPERSSERGKTLIPADSLASGIIIWENFMTRYPRFILKEMVQDHYARYLGAFLSGTENSRVFDADSNLLKQSSREAFESFISENSGRKSAEVVKSYLDLLYQTDFSYNEKVDSFLLEKVFSAGAEPELK